MNYLREDDVEPALRALADRAELRNRGANGEDLFDRVARLRQRRRTLHTALGVAVMTVAAVGGAVEARKLSTSAPLSVLSSNGAGANGAIRCPGRLTAPDPVRPAPGYPPANGGAVLCRYAGVDQGQRVGQLTGSYPLTAAHARTVETELRQGPPPPRGVHSCPNDSGQRLVLYTGRNGNPEPLVWISMVGCRVATFADGHTFRLTPLAERRISGLTARS